ncbi:DinB family protein [Solimonas variicoloris]|uniref:DinB family protein n=1 Tax=Solimonas variicoloris TaxID=254408 RepID=UPI001B7FDA4F|nr:DinB family protein [Solimonas variicoloris]
MAVGAEMLAIVGACRVQLDAAAWIRAIRIRAARPASSAARCSHGLPRQENERKLHAPAACRLDPTPPWSESMDLLPYARTMAAYNRWMNERLHEACAQLPDTRRREDLGAFFKSIHGTLNHLLLADRVWLGRFTGMPFRAAALDQELYAGFAELRVERERTDAAIEAWSATLTAHDFAGELSYTRISSPQPVRLPFWRALVHFFNHQTHHRGQITTLLKQSGIDPGVTDLIAMPAAELA